MPVPDLNEMAVFARVVQAGGFSAAARALGAPKSTPSRQVARLEDRLGARLLHRTTRHLSLTDLGAAYYERCARILAQAEEADLAVTDLMETPRGVLRLTAPVQFGDRYLGPAIAQYLRRHPEVGVEVVLLDRVVDLVAEGFDVGVRAGRLADGTLIARRLGAGSVHVCASPDYLARRGAPKGPDDLDGHECVRFGLPPDGRPWLLRSPGGAGDAGDAEPFAYSARGRVITNSFDIARAVALDGLGLAVLPAFIAAADLRSGALVEVMHGQAALATDIHVVYPSARHLSPKVRAFVDLLVERFTPTPPWAVDVGTPAARSRPADLAPQGPSPPGPARRRPPGTDRGRRGAG